MRCFDGHCDTLARCMTTGEGLRQNGGHVDLARCAALGQHAQIFAVFADSSKTSAPLYTVAQQQHALLERECARNADLVRRCRTARDVRAAWAAGKTAALLGIEGAELLECDPRLTATLEKHIGSGFRKDAAELEKLLAFADDETVLSELTAVKKANKEALADWLLHTQKVTVSTDAVFDIQSKRLHEYKRQQLNLLYLIHQYYEIKAGHLPAVPLVSIFGAKAAPAYTIAKDIIHALLTLSKVVAADPEVSKWLQVVFVENYNVTAAEKLIPACDLSEQISLASKEASGTGNMKFMLNGALTLGTMDGANVEISQQVGEENIYIFGQTSDQVIHRYAVGDYDPAQWVEGDANIRRAISFLTGPEMLAAGHAENLTRLHDELIHKDWFQTLPDFNAYVVRKGQALSDYACDPMGWRRKCLVNIAKAGMFSSDRTIAEYDRDIWHLGK